FAHPTVAALGRALSGAARADGVGEPPPAGVGEPASFAEERLLVVDALEPGLAIHNASMIVRLQGVDADVDAARPALDESVRRHGPLRTHFAREGGRFVPVVARPAPLDVPLVDLSPLDDHTRRVELDRRAADQASRPFDPARGPLVRALLVRLAPDELALV